MILRIIHDIRFTCQRVPIDDDAVHSTSYDNFKEGVIKDLCDCPRVREPIRMKRVQLLVQNDNGYLDSG